MSAAVIAPLALRSNRTLEMSTLCPARDFICDTPAAETVRELPTSPTRNPIAATASPPPFTPGSTILMRLLSGMPVRVMTTSLPEINGTNVPIAAPVSSNADGVPWLVTGASNWNTIW